MNESFWIGEEEVSTVTPIGSVQEQELVKGDINRGIPSTNNGKQ